MSNARKLNVNQRNFIDYLDADEKQNASEAYLKAYPNCKSKRAAEVKASELLKKDYIIAELERRRQKRMKRVQIDSDYVLRRLRDIDQLDVLDIMDSAGNLKAITDWPEAWRLYATGFRLVKVGKGRNEKLKVVPSTIRLPDKVKNLELLGKHTTVNAFKENIKADASLTVEIVRFADKNS